MGIVSDGQVIFGMQLPVQTLSTTVRDRWEDTATVDDMVRVARAAESSGQSFVGVCDHVAVPRPDADGHMSATWFDPIATLGFLAAATTRIRLLSVVWVAAYRHPLQTAKHFATLDHLSGGRALLGAGAGHLRGEFDALGVDYHARGRLLDDAIDAVRAALDHERVSVTTGRWQFDDVMIAPRPVQPRLPIWIGGTGPAAWRRAGRRGDGIIPMANPRDELPKMVRTIRAAARDAGRDDHGFDIGYMPGRIYVGDPDWDTGPWPLLSGSPGHIAAELAAAVEVGANVIHVRFAGRTVDETIEQIQMFGQDVAPRFGATNLDPPAATSSGVPLGGEHSQSYWVPTEPAPPEGPSTASRRP